jgi:hypothetical protein
MRTHALNRTSPKGGPFFGTCFQCGLTDLPAAAVSWPCENVANLTSNEAVLLAVSGPASVDTLPEGGDAKQAPCASKGSAVPLAADAQTPAEDQLND